MRRFLMNAFFCVLPVDAIKNFAYALRGSTYANTLTEIFQNECKLSYYFFLVSMFKGL